MSRPDFWMKRRVVFTNTLPRRVGSRKGRVGKMSDEEGKRLPSAGSTRSTHENLFRKEATLSDRK